MAQEWIDRVVCEQIAVNKDFEDRLQRSELSRQDWGLVRSAVEFDIEHPDDPDCACIVAETENLDAIMPELTPIATMGPLNASNGTSSGGLLDWVMTALGFGGGANGGDEALRDQAEQLAAEYAAALQQHLEDRGTWDTIRTSMSDG